MVKRFYIVVAFLISVPLFAQKVGFGYSSFTPGSMLSIKGNLAVGSGYETLSGSSEGAIIKGNVGIGTSTPSTSLQIASNAANEAIIIKGSNNTERIQMESYGLGVSDATEGPGITGVGATGTPASPTQTAANQFLGGMVVKGYDNAGTPALTGTRARFRVRAEEAFTTTTQGTYFLFETTDAGTTSLTEKMRLTSAGNLGIGTTTVTQKLEVNGAIDIGAATAATTGAIQYNTTSSDFEGYTGSAWKSLTGGSYCGKVILDTVKYVTTSTSFVTALNTSSPGLFYGMACSQTSGAASKSFITLTVDGLTMSTGSLNGSVSQQYLLAGAWLWDTGTSTVWTTDVTQANTQPIEFKTLNIQMKSTASNTVTCVIYYGTN